MAAVRAASAVLLVAAGLGAIVPPTARADALDELLGSEPMIQSRVNIPTCAEIATMAPDSLLFSKAHISALTPDEAALAKAELGLERAIERLAKDEEKVRAVDEKLAERLAVVRQKARAGSGGEVGLDQLEREIHEIVAEAAEINRQIAERDQEIRRLQSIISGISGKTADGTGLDIGREAGEEKGRVKVLQGEREALWTRKLPLASQFKEAQAKLGSAQARMEAEELRVRESMKLDLHRAKAVVAETKLLVKEFSDQARSVRQAAGAAQLARESLLACVASREQELKQEAAAATMLGTTEATATTAAVSATDGSLKPQPAPGSQPFPAAEFEGQTWRGTWSGECKEPGKTPHKLEGTVDLRLSGGKVAFMSGDHKDNPLEAELDPLGAFAVQESYPASGAVFTGQFQASTTPGTPRLSGKGEYSYWLDLSFLAGMIGGAATLGATGAEMPQLTPEEHERNTERCTGTWTLLLQ